MRMIFFCSMYFTFLMRLFGICMSVPEADSNPAPAAVGFIFSKPKKNVIKANRRTSFFCFSCVWQEIPRWFITYRTSYVPRNKSRINTIVSNIVKPIRISAYQAFMINRKRINAPKGIPMAIPICFNIRLLLKMGTRISQRNSSIALTLFILMEQLLHGIVVIL